MCFKINEKLMIYTDLLKNLRQLSLIKQAWKAIDSGYSSDYFANSSYKGSFLEY